MYDVIVSMSMGGPNRQSMSLSYYVSLLYFTDEKAGYASAIGIVTFFMILLITIPVNLFFRKKEVPVSYTHLDVYKRQLHNNFVLPANDRFIVNA